MACDWRSQQRPGEKSGLVGLESAVHQKTSGNDRSIIQDAARDPIA
jgi:hypothetical protein